MVKYSYLPYIFCVEPLQIELDKIDKLPMVSSDLFLLNLNVAFRLW